MARLRPVPPVYLLVSVVAMVGLHRLLPAAIVLRLPIRYGGAAFIGAGLALAVVAALRLKRHGTSVHPFHQPTALVTDGPYRITRNPIYLAMVAALFGWAVWLGSLTPFAVIPPFMLAMRRGFVEPEERRLTEAFGPAYLDHRGRVRRWL